MTKTKTYYLFIYTFFNLCNFNKTLINYLIKVYISYRFYFEAF